MDERASDPVGGRDLSRRDPAEDFILPSRVAALGTLRRAFATQAGPVLVSGEAGVGKTWLWQRLRSEKPAPGRWLCVDITPAVDPGGFYRLVGHGLGLPGLGEPAGSRSLLSDYLSGRADDGAHWILVVDEAQNASDDVAEEVRVLANRLGRPDGFSAIILAGQTPLARRLASTPLAALGARLEARVALRPLDIEEARALLDRLADGRSWDVEVLERLHRDCGGNPRRLLRSANAATIERQGRRATFRPPDRPGPRQPAIEEPPTSLGTLAERGWEAPFVGAPRPPLREEEGVIEVGWEPTPEPASELEIDDPSEALGPALRQVGGDSIAEVEADEVIDDHYAALRAWSEWARTHGRSPAASVSVQAAPATSLIEPHEALEEQLDDSADGSASPTNVWTEGQQGFAPYSQLFSRLRQARDSR
jgi:general secretion pathway protein A